MANNQNRLYIGNLAWKTTEASLRAAFADFGPVKEVKIVTERETGRSKGFGFITFENEVDAANAIKALDGYTLDNRELRVREAEDRKPMSPAPYVSRR